MYKYFEKSLECFNMQKASHRKIQEYKASLIAYMKELGASEAELSLIHDEAIQNSILNKINPEDTAWAILQ